jgi:DNA-binding phage protein
MNNSSKQKRSMVTYKSYSFVDKDPIIDQCRTIVEDEGETYLKIHEMSGVSTSTLYNWFRGETKRPQFASIMAVVRSLGYDMQLTRVATSDRPKTVARFSRKKWKTEPDRSTRTP